MTLLQAVFVLSATFVLSVKSQTPTEFLCKRLKPQEDTSYFAKGTGPYSMALAKKDGYVEVKIEAKEGSHFQGFNVEARQDGATDEPFGEFRDQPDLSFTECAKIPKSLASQKDKTKKTSVTLKWNIPASVLSGSTILFKATVTKQFLEYNHLNEAIKI